MNDFELMKHALSEYEKTKTQSPKEEVNGCKHPNKTIMNNVNVCMDCGEELSKNICMDKEWRYYSGGDNRHSSDPSRCQIRKNDEKNIFKDVESMGLSESIVNVANSIYLDVTKKEKKNPNDPDEQKIHRGRLRRSIIFGCVFNAYKISDNPQTCESLIKLFNIDKKAGLNGLKLVSMNAPKRSPVRTTYITPVHLLAEILNKFDASQSKKDEVTELYNKIKNKSERIKRSRPQSIASSLVYYWICLKGINITIKEYSEKVGLSVLTISKLAKEIETILETPGIVK